jgi:uncharacterized protein YbjT (DUF2867 family)
MKLILFGATGMIGQAALRECLADPKVEQVLSVGRTAPAAAHPKLAHLAVPDLLDYTAVEDRLAGYDACLYCLGISSAGMDEADYTRVTYDFALAAGEVLVRRNPAMVLVFISGAHTDPASRTLWARVKGRTEQALLALPWRGAYMLRPGFIQPLHGIRSRTASYRILYALLSPFVPLLKRLMPGSILSTDELGRAMLRIAREGAPKARLEVPDLKALGA